LLLPDLLPSHSTPRDVSLSSITSFFPSSLLVPLLLLLVVVSLLLLLLLPVVLSSLLRLNPSSNHLRRGFCTFSRSPSPLAGVAAVVVAVAAAAAAALIPPPASFRKETISSSAAFFGHITDGVNEGDGEEEDEGEDEVEKEEEEGEGGTTRATDESLSEAGNEDEEDEEAVDEEDESIPASCGKACLAILDSWPCSGFCCSRCCGSWLDDDEEEKGREGIRSASSTACLSLIEESMLSLPCCPSRS